jgi:hypothetical protein
MKCILCNEEFPENISDFDLVQHFINKHNEKVKIMGRDILKLQSKKIKLTENKNSVKKVVK